MACAVSLGLSLNLTFFLRGAFFCCAKRKRPSDSPKGKGACWGADVWLSLCLPPEPRRCQPRTDVGCGTRHGARPRPPVAVPCGWGCETRRADGKVSATNASGLLAASRLAPGLLLALTRTWPRSPLVRRRFPGLLGGDGLRQPRRAHRPRCAVLRGFATAFRSRTPP